MKFIIYFILIFASWKWARYNSKQKARMMFRENSGLDNDPDSLKTNHSNQSWSNYHAFSGYIWFVILIIWTIVDAIYDVI